jgi:hypothetical protein
MAFASSVRTCRYWQPALVGDAIDSEKEAIEPDPTFLMGMHFHDLRAKALTDDRQEAP